MVAYIKSWLCFKIALTMSEFSVSYFGL